MGQNDFASRKGWLSRVVVGFWRYSVAPHRHWRWRVRRQSRRTD
jgi:hypothetical protein